VTADHYIDASSGWARGATLVYGPIAAQLVAMSPHSLASRRVLDCGAGTGAVTAALVGVGARPVGVDLSRAMLAWDAQHRPPSVVADVRALPLATASVDDSVAAFVLNHLTDPQAGFAELARVTRRGGAVVASAFSTASASPVRERIDAVARDAGWLAPAWYTEMKATVVPLLGSAESMASAATAGGLDDVAAEERPVDVGVTEPWQLVDYRLGQAHFAAWLQGIGPDRAAVVRRRAIDEIRPVMEPYRPIVVFLTSRAR
jgi:SAM-dependent methyltransferase